MGSYPAVSLKDARERRDDNRRMLAQGRSPAAARKADRMAQEDTFEAISRECLELQRSKMSTATFSKSKWLLEDLLFPYIGRKPIATIGAGDLLDALRKTEDRGRNESAHRAKQKAGQVFRFAIVTGRATHDPAASLKGALAPVVSRSRSAVTDPQQIGELLRTLDGYRGQPGTEIALKLAPLVFVRPGELRQAQWEEFTLEGGEPLWRIPAERTKMRVEHLVPLSRQAVELLRRLEPITGPRGYLFPSLRTGARPISENTLNAALRRLGYDKETMTTHGFRAMASTSLNEQGFAPDVIELQLAHKERNKVRAAYNRAQRLIERRNLMQHWADYLDGVKKGAHVIPIGRSA